METTVEREDPAVGYTWGRAGDTRYLRNADGEFRGVSENVLKLLDDLATGEATKADLPDNALRIVRRLERLGYLRPDAPVVRIDPPDDVRFWPRFGLFSVLTGLALFAAWRNRAVVADLDAVLSPVGSALLVGLALATIVIHESGHVLASRPYLDPSPRLGTVNGFLPAFISDTNGAWMLPRNRRRWISLAGPFAHVVWVLGLAGLEYAVFPENHVLQAAAVFFSVSLLATLNPLIHGDGYWLLVDTFDLVNLRSRGINDLHDRRPSLPAAYVVLSYSFGAAVFLVSVYYLLAWGTVGVVAVVGLAALVGFEARDQLRALADRATSRLA
jgi:hypothetical protein